MLTLLRLDCAVLSFLLILPDTKLLNHIHWPPHKFSCNRLSRMWRSDCSTRQKQKHYDNKILKLGASFVLRPVTSTSALVFVTITATFIYLEACRNSLSKNAFLILLLRHATLILSHQKS